jgi:hypothetical protein
MFRIRSMFLGLTYPHPDLLVSRIRGSGSVPVPKCHGSITRSMILCLAPYSCDIFVTVHVTVDRSCFNISCSVPTCNDLFRTLIRGS